jgi:hypothetical protein
LFVAPFLRHDVGVETAGHASCGKAEMASDPEGDRRTPSPVERMINALDEVRDAVKRLAGETRATAPQPVPDFERVEPSSAGDGVQAVPTQGRSEDRPLPEIPS